MPRARVLNILQAGRAVAALAVVVHHASLAAKAQSQALPGDPFFHAGYLGVDFFFVLSGFIIAYTTLGRKRSMWDYARARITRVYLPYWPLGLAIAAVYTLLPTISGGDYAWSWLPTITLAPVGQPALFVAWTLQHEILFYALFGLFFFVGRLWLGMALWAVAIMAWPLLGAGAAPIALKPINLEFLFGIVVALHYRRASLPVAVAGLACIAGWILLGGQREQSVLFGLGLAGLLAVAVRLDEEGRLHSPAWLVFTGNASYSIYLAHTIAISIAVRLLPSHNWLIFVGGIIASTVAGFGYHLMVERPLLKLSGGRASVPKLWRNLPLRP